MVDERPGADAPASVEVKSHQKRLYRSRGFQTPVQAPSDDIAAVTVCQQRQIQEAVPISDVGDIGHSHLSAGRRLELGRGVQQVLVDAELVMRESRSDTILFLPKHHTVGAKYIVETVSPNREPITEVLAAEHEQFTAAGLGKTVLRTHPAAIHYNAGNQDTILRIFLNMLVITIAADAKQSAEGCLTIAPLRQALNYLAPDFFLIGKL